MAPGFASVGRCNAAGSLHHYTNVFTGYQAGYMPFQSLVAAQRYPIKSETGFEATRDRMGDNTTQECTSPLDLCCVEYKVASFPNRPSSSCSPFCISVRLSLWARARDVFLFGQEVAIPQARDRCRKRNERRVLNNGLKVELVTFEQRILNDNPTKEVREEIDKQSYGRTAL
ncbi:hypothetical protein CBL_01352 [Carabus blaptoides fortunei]